MELNKALIVDV